MNMGQTKNKSSAYLVAARGSSPEAAVGSQRFRLRFHVLLLMATASQFGVACESGSAFEGPEQTQTARSEIQAAGNPPPDNNAVFGFESAGSWSTTTSGATLSQSSTHSQGSSSLSVRPSNSNGYTPIASVPLSTLNGVSPTLALDVMLPKYQPNPSWLGTVQIYLNSPSCSIHNQFLAQVELTGKPLNVWNTLNFPLNNTEVTDLLQAGYSDLVITVVLNVQVPTTGTYLVDNLRFLPVAANGCRGLPNGTSCTDGNACTVGDTCQSNTCQAGTPVTCSAPDQCHTAGTCVPSTGVCTGSSPISCDDGLSCTTDSCDAGSGCVHTGRCGAPTTRAVSVVVNSALYGQIAPAFATYVQDLENEGYMVLVHTMTSTPPASDLRNLLIADHNTYGIEGAFFIGNLPYALGVDTVYPYPAPLEYYFMDLTGTWTDSNSDGAFDQHSDPDHGPEIYSGRLRADNMVQSGQTEAALVNSYFQRNHAYRTAGSSLPQRAVAFDAFTWSRPQRLEAVYGVSHVTDHTNPSGTDFLNLLGSESGEFYFVISDSWPTGHSFAAPHPNVLSSDIAAVSKAYHFYLLHACSAADFSTSMNLASTYVLVNTQGLAAIGVTKSSSTGYFNDRFASNFMAMDQTLGKALFNFDTLYMNDDPNYGGYGEGEFYITGDPTLRLNSKAGTLPPPSQPRSFVWKEFNDDYQYSLAALSTDGGYYDISYFTTLGTTSQWQQDGNRGLGDHNDDVHVTTAAEDFSLFTFDGSAVEYYAETGPNEGKMDVYVDFVFNQTIDLSSAAQQVQQLVYSAEWNANGRHSLLLVNKIAGKSGVVDFFRVRQDQ